MRFHKAKSESLPTATRMGFVSALIASLGLDSASSASAFGLLQSQQKFHKIRRRTGNRE
jgi:hypothetical protein